MRKNTQKKQHTSHNKNHNSKKVKGTITKITDNGSGILYDRNDRIFVRNVLLNEVVEVSVEKKIKEGYVGHVSTFVSHSSHRVPVSCSFYQQCGSCHLLHVDYPHQLKMKKQMMIDLVKGSKLSLDVQDCEGMDNPYAYRNKVIISFTKDRGEWKAGFYEEFTHRIIPIRNCLLHEECVNELINDIINIVKKCRIDVYDENRRTGFLRHILIRRAVHTNQTMLTIVGAEKIFKGKRQFVDEVLKKHPQIQTIVFNCNNKKSSTVLGVEERVLYGRGHIEDKLCGQLFKISPRSFYQINHEQCEKLYTKALSLLELTNDMSIVDAYCGIGTIGLIAAPHVKQVLSVEVNRDAIQDAILNAKRNNVQNIRFECADASEYMETLAQRHTQVDALIMDPAREGSDERFMKSVCQLAPAQIIYISCNPQTQIRDISYFLQHGYTTDRKMYLYDLFPQTFHVESVVLMSKAK